MSLRESCAIFGIYAPDEEVARLTFFALFALQHRGQESSGIATTDGRRIRLHAGMGLVSQVFDETTLGQLPGVMAIGHNRYSTMGSSRRANVQPILVKGAQGEIALGHNGNIINSVSLRRELAEQGYSFFTSTDSEVIANLILASPGKTWVERIQYVMPRLQGAYSLVILTPEAVIGVRDPLGVRPLCLGSLDGGWVIASESCALDHLDAHILRPV